MTQDRARTGRVTRRSMLFGAVGVVGAAAFLAACGDDDDAGGSGDTTARRRHNGAATTAGDDRRWRRRHRWPAGHAARRRRGDVGQGHDRSTLGAVLALTGHGFVLRQDDEPRPRPRRQAHRGGRRPEVQLHLPRPQVGRCRRRRGRRSPSSARKNVPAKFASYVDDLGAMLDGTAAVQDVHARRRRRHQHLRPGQAVLLGHPGDHAERPDARAVQVHEGDLPRRQDGRAGRLGHRRAEQRASSRTTS